MSAPPVSHPALEDYLYNTAQFPLPWLMSMAERSALLHVLGAIRPEVALEVGTASGGSLQHISAHAKRVFSIDIDPGVRQRLSGRMPNVEFLTGDSKKLIAKVLGQIETMNENLQFVLIDGDHSFDGVKGDINAVLAVRPRKPLWVLMHDSINPDCRDGMRSAQWEANPHVHHVELDFVPGSLTTTPEFAGFLWGGLALALLLPQKREGLLPILESSSRQNQILCQRSVHYPRWAYPLRLWLRVKRKGLQRRIEKFRN